jgi:hypothetical protein
VEFAVRAIEGSVADQLITFARAPKSASPSSLDRAAFRILGSSRPAGIAVFEISSLRVLVRTAPFLLRGRSFLIRAIDPHFQSRFGFGVRIDPAIG